MKSVCSSFFSLFNDRLKLIDDNERQAYGIIVTYF